MPEALTGRALHTGLQRLYPAPHYALAVSGGPDSMALMALVAKAMRLKNAPNFSVLTVNHGLRPEAHAEARMVAHAAKKLGLGHMTLRSKGPAPKKVSQKWARETRYGLMASWCRQHKADALVLAHHLDDQAETVLMRLAHGSGADGLSGMAEKQTLMTTKGALVLLRPLLAHRRSRLHGVLAKSGLPSIVDASNDNMDFERVRWRKRMPHLAVAGVSATDIAALACRYRALRGQTNRMLSAWLRQHVDVSPFGYVSVERCAFQQADRAFQQRVLRRLVHHVGQEIYPPAADKIERLVSKIVTTAHSGAALGGCMVRWRGREVMIGREANALVKFSPLGVKAGKQIWDGRFVVYVNAKQNTAGLFVAPLGKVGLAAVRMAGGMIDKRVPTSYLAALPAFFDAHGFRACPLLLPATGFGLRLADNFSALATP